MDSPGANCLGTTRCALADAVGCRGVPSGLVCVLHMPVEAAVPLFSVCSSGPLQLASSPPPSPPTPLPSPPPPSAALPARGFPFCLCNRSTAHTPFTWSVQSETTLNQVTRIDGTIGVRNCSTAANPCCQMDLHKVEFLVGDGCQRSVAATFVNGRQVSWSFHSHGTGRLSFKLTNLGLSTATAAGVQLQVHLLQASACGTAATFFRGRSLAFFNAAQTCCPAFSLSLP
ncbi:Pherophorin-domain-containing protein [Haematococcus lacustris]